MNNPNPWVRFNDAHPTEEGFYEWRVPSKALPGVVLIVAAKMRMRGAGFEYVLSPEFDYWDGYRVHVQCDVEWRNLSVKLKENQSSIVVLSIEGLEVSECSHCGQIPTIEAVDVSRYGGVAFSPNPWNLNTWRFTCCNWGSTPRMSDPREIERIRRLTRNKATA